MKIIFLTEDEFRAIIREEYKNHTTTIGSIQIEEKPVSQQEICRFLNITEPTLIRWRAKNNVPFLKIGSRVLYQKSVVLAALGNKKGFKNG